MTIFIGANDLCAYNKDKNYYSSENYFKYLQAMTIPKKKTQISASHYFETMHALKVAAASIVKSSVYWPPVSW